jgi:23S rRNA pseudouridine2605 synthase
VRGDGEAAVDAMQDGVELEDGVVLPRHVAAERISRGRWKLTITIAEGKNREIRRLCEAVGLEVDRLVRIRFGPVELGELASGKMRSLTKKELQALERL